jgi:hypothetical protein
MKRPWLVLILSLAACGGSPASKGPPGGSGGDDTGGEGGTPGGSGGGGSSGSGGGTDGSGGAPAKDAAPATAADAASAPDASADASPPTTADCPGAGPTSIFCNTVAPLPKTIKETGVFPSAPDFSKHPASLHEYVPDPPLWSDGLSKQRFLLLPQGKKIDNQDGKRWVFPVGTVFIKTFFDDGGAAGKPRPIETRFLRRVDEAGSFVEYDYNVYQWNADGSDATLVDISMKRTPVMITVKALGAPFSHDIPSRDDCASCHESNGKVAQTFIGFDELRLGGKAPGATSTQLQDLAALFTQPPPAQPAQIADADPRLLRIKRFVFGNCVHCHNGKTIVDLHPDVFVTNTVGKMTDASGVTAPAGWLRVFPGKPEMSVLFVEARRTMLPVGLKPMPQIGVAVAEPDAITDLKAWITPLK